MKHLHLRETGQWLAAHTGGSMIQNISTSHPRLGLRNSPRMHNLISVGLKSTINRSVWGEVWFIVTRNMGFY
jgi:hypothetical protein